MDTMSPNNLGQRGSQPIETLTTAPPPPSEVKIRTMRSDLESMAASGGGLPRFQNVKISVTPPERQTQIASSQNQSKINVGSIVLVIIIFAVIMVGGWFAYSTFLANKITSLSPIPPVPNSQSTQSAPVVVPTSTPSAPATIPNQASTSVQGMAISQMIPAHISAFKLPADQTLAISFSDGAAQNASELQSYSQKIATLVSTAKKTATLIEIVAKNEAGNYATVSDLFREANAQIFDSTVLTTDFDPDGTFFVYRDKNGSWPGYIVPLASNKNWLFISSDVQQIESSVNLSNLFLKYPGTPSATGFGNGVLASTTVRILPYTGGVVPSWFVYGWSPNHEYLILSTSQGGFSAAIKHLR